MEHAAGLDRGVWDVMTGLPYLIRIVPTLAAQTQGPRFRGMDLTGRVEAIGSNVTRFQPGAAVFGWCDGSYAEYACAPEDHFAPKPPNLSFEQAAAVPISGFAALRVFATRESSSLGRRSWSSGRRGAWGRSRCSGPRRSAAR
jgi:NADPH:quinone reductase-like Zn-dependent oxidoreductase